MGMHRRVEFPDTMRSYPSYLKLLPALISEVIGHAIERLDLIARIRQFAEHPNNAPCRRTLGG